MSFSLTLPINFLSLLINQDSKNTQHGKRMTNESGDPSTCPFLKEVNPMVKLANPMVTQDIIHPVDKTGKQKGDQLFDQSINPNEPFNFLVVSYHLLN